MTKTEIERLAILETRIDAVDERTERIEAKLDEALLHKAEKSELDAVCTKVTAHEKTLNEWKGSLNATRWVGQILGAIFSGIVVAVVTHLIMGG